MNAFIIHAQRIYFSAMGLPVGIYDRTNDRRVTLIIDQNIAETYFSELDRHFADFMVELAGKVSSDRQRNLWLAAALVSAYVGKGHVCLNLSDSAGALLGTGEDEEMPLMICPGIDEWVDSLKELSVVGCPGEFKPLVLDEKMRL